MIEGVTKMGCGGCGKHCFEIYSADKDFSSELHIQCKECKSVTVVRPTQPKIEFDWGEKSDGILTFI